MTSNHFLLVILYFLSNFFLFIAEASAVTDDELKAKFFNDQCKDDCNPEFKACYQILKTDDRFLIINDLIGQNIIHKVTTVENSSFYTFGSDTVSTQVAVGEFNKAVGAKCNALRSAQAKAASPQATTASTGNTASSSSGKSDRGSSSSGDLVKAAKEMAPIVASTETGKELFAWGNANIGKAVDAAKDKVGSLVGKGDGNVTSENISSDAPAESMPTGHIGSVQNAEHVPQHLISNRSPSSSVNSDGATPSTASNSSPVIKDSAGEVVAPNMNHVEKPTTPPTPEGIQQAGEDILDKNKSVAAESPTPTEAQKVVDSKNLTTTDPVAETGKAQAASAAEKAQGSLEKVIVQMESAGGICAKEISAIRASSKKYLISKQTCGSDSALAGNFCDTVRSPKALDVQKMISAGTAVLSKATAASESCGIMGNVSTLANGGMLAAQAVCSGFKFKCDFSCADAKKEIINIAKINNESITSCINTVKADASCEPNEGRAKMLEGFALQIETAQGELNTIVKAETPAVQPHIDLCQKFSIDIATMGAQAAALLSAAKDSKKCEEQLSSGGGSGKSATGSLATTAEFCAQPENASNITCRCAADPNAAGCLGSLASGKLTTTGSDVSGLAGLQKGVGNVSGFASAASPKISNSDIQFDGLDKDIAAGKTNNSGAGPVSPFGSATAGGGGGSGGAGGGVAGSSKSGGAATEEEKSKFSMGFSSLAKGFGNLFGSKPNDKGGKSLSKEQKEVQLQSIKRKIASDQVRSEISTASGKSNFDKIKERYTETRSSLISTP